SPIPVRIWIVSIVSDALPKTYHQPIGPANSLGTGWVSIGHKLVRRLRRASNHLPRVWRRCFIAAILLLCPPVVGGREIEGVPMLAAPTGRNVIAWGAAPGILRP